MKNDKKKITETQTDKKKITETQTERMTGFYDRAFAGTF